MAKKVVLKRKIKVVAILLFILIVFLVCLIVKSVLDIRIKNIYVLNNSYLKDDYIIEKAGLSDYPSYFRNFSYFIEKKLINDDFIKDATVSKKFFGVINIEVVENKVLFYRMSDNKYVLEDGTVVDSIPYEASPIRVVNYIPDTVYADFVKKLAKIDYDVRSKISEIKYDPSEYDNARFMFYMSDGNYVYTTITKLEALNYYNEIYPTLEGKKGILYLDSGNHFQEIK